MPNWFKNVFARLYRQREQPSIRIPYNLSGGGAVTPETSMQVSAYYRGVIYVSSQIAKLPCQIKDSKNNIKKDRLAKLLSVAPNPEMNSMRFWLCQIQNSIHYGNSFAEIERDLAGRPIALWPIPSEHMDFYRDTASGQLYYRIIGGTFSAPNGDTLIEPKNIFHIPNLHTKDGVVGQGVIAYARDTLGIALGADRFANGLFANAGMPSGAVKLKGKLDDDAYARVKESWQVGHGGRKAGSTVFLEDGAEYQTISHDPETMQFLESRKFSVLEIARFLGVPPTKLYDGDTAKFNNQEQSNLEVVTDTLSTWARVIEMEVQFKLIDYMRSDDICEIDLFEISRGDMETRTKYYTGMMQTASITPNEIRTGEGKTPYAGGDRYYIANNNFAPQDRLDELLDSQIERNKGGAKAKKEEEDDEEDKDDQKKLTKAVLGLIENK